MSEQLSLPSGEARKESGLDMVIANDLWLAGILREYAMTVSAKSGFVTSDNLRVYADQMGYKPHSPNFWGGIFRGLKWKIVGRQRSAIPGNHAREIKVWRYEP